MFFCKIEPFFRSNEVERSGGAWWDLHFSADIADGMDELINGGELFFDSGVDIDLPDDFWIRSDDTGRRLQRLKGFLAVGVFCLREGELFFQQLEELFGDKRRHWVKQTDGIAKHDEQDFLFVAPIGRGALLTKE